MAGEDDYRVDMASETSTLDRRLGMTVPLPGPLHSHKEWLHELADVGYTDIWSAKATVQTGLPLGARRRMGTRLRLGTAIIPAYTRHQHAWRNLLHRWLMPPQVASASALVHQAT